MISRLPRPLVFPFAMVVHNKFVDGPSQVPLAEHNEPLQAGFLDSSDKALGMGIVECQQLQVVRVSRPVIKAAKITAHVRLRGGATRTLTVDRPLPMARISKNKPQVVAEVDVC